MNNTLYDVSLIQSVRRLNCAILLSCFRVIFKSSTSYLVKMLQVGRIGRLSLVSFVDDLFQFFTTTLRRVSWKSVQIP